MFQFCIATFCYPASECGLSLYLNSCAFAHHFSPSHVLYMGGAVWGTTILIYVNSKTKNQQTNKKRHIPTLWSCACTPERDHVKCCQAFCWNILDGTMTLLLFRFLLLLMYQCRLLSYNFPLPFPKGKVRYHQVSQTFSRYFFAKVFFGPNHQLNTGSNRVVFCLEHVKPWLECEGELSALVSRPTSSSSDTFIHF